MQEMKNQNIVMSPNPFDIDMILKKGKQTQLCTPQKNSITTPLHTIVNDKSSARFPFFIVEDWVYSRFKILKRVHIFHF